MIRLFIALNLPETVISQIINLEKNMTGVHWLNPNTFHTTLVFCGNVNIYLYRQIKRQLKNIYFEPFSLRVNKFEIFRSPNRKPHKLVAVIEPDQKLIDLQYEINSTISMLHPKLIMQTRYQPHISVAKLENIDFDEVQMWTKENENVLDEEFEVEHFSLFSSKLTNSGLAYTLIENYAMK